jgi:dUTP pyrophosphatase
MEIKLKKLQSDVKIPSYAHPGDAGLDLFCRESCVIEPGQRKRFDLGFSLELPEGYVGLIWDKGSLSHNHGLHTIAGVYDYGYRGEYNVTLINLSDSSYKFEKGDKIAQLLIQPIIQAKLTEASELNQTSRDKGRFGSTGKS